MDECLLSILQVYIINIRPSVREYADDKRPTIGLNSKWVSAISYRASCDGFMESLIDEGAAEAWCVFKCSSLLLKEKKDFPKVVQIKLESSGTVGLSIVLFAA